MWGLAPSQIPSQLLGEQKLVFLSGLLGRGVGPLLEPVFSSLPTGSENFECFYGRRICFASSFDLARFANFSPALPQMLVKLVLGQVFRFEAEPSPVLSLS